MSLPDPFGLGNIFAGQFHQDFDSEYGRIAAALWQTLDQSDVAGLTAVIEGIEDVLRGGPSARDLQDWFDYIGLGLWLMGDEPPTHREFLGWIRQEAEEELTRRQGALGEGPRPRRPMLDTWTHNHHIAYRADDGKDRVVTMLTHPSATIEALVAADLDDRPEEVLADDQWLLCLDGMLTLEVDTRPMVFGRDDVLAMPAGTRFLMAAARPDSRWLRIRMTPHPFDPTDLPHPGAVY